MNQVLQKSAIKYPERPEFNYFNSTSLNEVANSFRALAPFSNQTKQKYLDFLMGLVDYYQPQIEGKTGVELGEITVDDFRNRYKTVLKNCWDRENPDINMALPYKIVGTMVGASVDFLRGLFMAGCYEDGNIYYSFNQFGRARVLLGGVDEDRLIVHELSHGLWEKLSGERISVKNKPSNFRDWVEGFAEYCALDYFFEFYPNSKKPFDQGIYSREKWKLERLVERYGQQVILEVPKRWKEFE